DLNNQGAPKDVSGSFSIPVDLGVDDGTQVIRLYAADLALNPAASSIEFSVILDTTPPDLAPELMSLNDAGHVDGSGKELFTFAGGEGAVSDRPDIAVPMTVTDVASGLSTSLTSNTDGGFSRDIAVQSGDPLDIVATDDAGNSSIARIQFGATCFTNATNAS